MSQGSLVAESSYPAGIAIKYLSDTTVLIPSPLSLVWDSDNSSVLDLDLSPEELAYCAVVSSVVSPP